MKDGEADFSKYTHEQIERSLSRIDREKFPLNHANLLAAQRALPSLPMDDASIEAREDARVYEAVVNGSMWISAPALLTFWLPCVRRVVVRGADLEIRGYFKKEVVPLADIARVRWYDARPIGEWHLALIELRRGPAIRILPRSRAVMRALATHVGAVQGGIDVADSEYQSSFAISLGD